MSHSKSDIEVIERLKHLCSRAEKSPQDIIDKLKNWKYDGDPLYIIGVLRKDRFIDDERFASSFVNDKIKFSKWGKNKIRFHLKHKGITSDIIQPCLDEFSVVEYEKIVMSELNKKNKLLKEEDTYKRKQKLIAFGNQRGYENDLIIKFTDEHIENCSL